MVNVDVPASSKMCDTSKSQMPIEIYIVKVFLYFYNLNFILFSNEINTCTMMGYSKGTDDFQNWIWCYLKKFHLIFCMIVRQHLTPKQKEILDHKVRLCLVFCYLQWTLLLKTTTFFGIRHQSLFAFYCSFTE